MILPLTGPGIDDLKVQAVAVSHDHITNLQDIQISLYIKGAFVVPDVSWHVNLETFADKRRRISGCS